MSDVIYSILAATPYTYTIACGLALWAGLIIKTFSDSTLLAMFFAPFLMIGALFGVYFFREFEIVFAPDRDSNIVASSAAGMCLTILVILVICRISGTIADRRKTGLEDRMDQTLTSGKLVPRPPQPR